MADYDYVIVGSGAGGGPLAANLAKAGFSVLLLEAGLDSCAESEVGRLMYEVPLFHGFSTEYQGCAWNFYVRHYADDFQQAKDSKFLPKKGGVWYPRAGTLGGCTAHNAMITVVPQDSDWNHIAAVTGDRSWAADQMRPYFSRIENCTYVSRPGSIEGLIEGKIEGALSSIGELLTGREDWRDSTHGHGFAGWLTTSEADPRLVLKDPQIVLLLLNSAKEALKSAVGDPLLRTETRFDPNDSRNAAFSPEGLAFTPLAVKDGKRTGPREHLLRTQQAFPQNLTIRTGALATRVLFEGAHAIGVEFLEGVHLYEADPRSGSNFGVKRQVRAGREVILCGGAFNSPQLLLLSGVGPRAQLEQFGIPSVCDLPGVGKNLQDRYEIAVVSEFWRNFTLMADVPFHPPEAGAAPDPYLLEWEQGRGLYGSNGALIGIVKRSSPSKADPDLYIFGMPSDFKGYLPGYSLQSERYRDRFTWAILKARTNNTAGQVSLRSSDPLVTPRIDFHYFDEGNDAAGDDLESLVAAVEFVRGMNSRLAATGVIKEELTPGPSYQTREELREFIRNEAWGHHASCSNRMGGDSDEMAVLDSRFRVRGTSGLRVVDASVFPRIPGYFIATAVYMASEKAADVIAEDA